MLLNKILVTASLLTIISCIIKYNRNINKDDKNNKHDNNNTNIYKKDKITQTKISFNKNESFLIKVSLNENNNKWYDIIDEIVP